MGPHQSPGFSVGIHRKVVPGSVSQSGFHVDKRRCECVLFRLLSESCRVDGLDVLFSCSSVVWIADFAKFTQQGTHF